MTRFAKGGQKRKRQLDATSWSDLKGDSKQKTEKSVDKGTHEDKKSTIDSENTVAHPGSRAEGVSTPTTDDQDGDKGQKLGKKMPFIKGNRRQRETECYNCYAKGHKASKCPEPSKLDSMVCHACKGLGHKAYKCPNSDGSEWKGKPSGQNSKGSEWSGKRPFPNSHVSGAGTFNKQNRPEKVVWDKERRSEWRRQKRENERDTKMHCFNCRGAGHQVSECPELKKDVEQGTGICFKCGSTEHSVHQCRVKVPKDKFPYAKCFICNETGHLSKQCPDNPRGLYPDGGCCNQCGSVEHLKRDCPEYQKRQGIGDITLDRLDTGTTVDIESVGAPAKKQKKMHYKQSGPKTVKF